MKRGFYTLVIMMVIWVGTVYGQLPTEVNEPSIAGTFAQSGENVTLGLIAGVPIEKINGHAALFAQRSMEGEETLS